MNGNDCGDTSNKMNVGIVIAIGSILLSMSTPIFAYDEPDNFAGVKFGEDVRTQIPSCAEVYNSPKDERCWYQSRPDAVRGEFNRLGEIGSMMTSAHY